MLGEKLAFLGAQEGRVNETEFGALPTFCILTEWFEFTQRVSIN